MPGTVRLGGGWPRWRSSTCSPSARNGATPLGASGRCSASLASLSWSRKARSRSPVIAGGGAAGRAASSVRRSSFTTASLLALRLCSSRQTRSSPARARRPWTTCSAAIFSATNSTDFPSLTAAAMMLAMVCDLPVPGGPCTTRLRPRRMVSITSACDKSASSTCGRAVVSSSRSSDPVSGKSGSHGANPSASSPRSKGCAAIASCGQLSGTRSRNISSLENENRPASMPSSSTDQRCCEATARRTAAK